MSISPRFKQIDIDNISISDIRLFIFNILRFVLHIFQLYKNKKYLGLRNIVIYKS